MKKLFYIFIFIIILTFTSRIYSQINLVPNYSFETYSQCPQNLGQIQFATGWYNPNLGFQYAQQGVAYAGIVAYQPADVSGTYYFPNYWEYVQCELADTLIACQTYSLSFYVSLSSYGEYAVSQIGAYLSTTAINSGNYKYLPYTPQIVNPPTKYITDTLNWTLISGTFVAAGGEKYITIGDFQDSLNIDTIAVVSRRGFGKGAIMAYYYIDAIELVKGISCFGDTTVTPPTPPTKATTLINPNVFTPNGDGVNDTFVIIGLNINDKVIIYDRWGIKISEFNGTSNGWNGRTEAGEKCSDGVYYYIIRFAEKFPDNIESKGFIQLIQ